MTLDQRISAFVKLGKFLNAFLLKQSKTQFVHQQFDDYFEKFQTIIDNQYIKNPWFTPDNSYNAINSIAIALNETNIIDFTGKYLEQLSLKSDSKTVAVILAGNIPLVGFHDWFCVLMAGHTFKGKLSADDDALLPFLSKLLIEFEPQFEKQIVFTPSQLGIMDAVIATGSNNTARYFDYYFGKYPHIIRRNRNSVAVLDSTETFEDINNLGKDIFQYFGLGCRNVSKLFVPKGYRFDFFFENIIQYNKVIQHNKYANNYEYNRTVYLMGQNPTLLDNNFLLLKEDLATASPIGVMFYEFYESIEQVIEKLNQQKDSIQCVVSKNKAIKNAVGFGQTQCPSLSDFSDNVDTMQFLLNL